MSKKDSPQPPPTQVPENFYLRPISQPPPDKKHAVGGYDMLDVIKSPGQPPPPRPTEDRDATTHKRVKFLFFIGFLLFLVGMAFMAAGYAKMAVLVMAIAVGVITFQVFAPVDKMGKS